MNNSIDIDGLSTRLLLPHLPIYVFSLLCLMFGKSFVGNVFGKFNSGMKGHPFSTKLIKDRKLVVQNICWNIRRTQAGNFMRFKSLPLECLFDKPLAYKKVSKALVLTLFVM